MRDALIHLHAATCLFPFGKVFTVIGLIADLDPVFGWQVFLVPDPVLDDI